MSVQPSVPGRFFIGMLVALILVAPFWAGFGYLIWRLA